MCRTNRWSSSLSQAGFAAWRWVRCAVVATTLCLLGATTDVSAQDDLLQRAAPPTLTTTPHNFHLVVTEAFLNRFVARDEAEPGRIDDFIFGAKVDGDQWTKRSLRLDLIPSYDYAAGVFVLQGQVDSVTIGRTGQGAVQSVGRQDFHAYKDVFFDGNVFSTRHATVFARSFNQPVAAATQLDGTILQRVGQKIALSRAEQQRPQTEAYGRDRVANRVFPTFDGGVDQQLGLANQQLQTRVRSALEQVKLLPTSQRVLTTDTHLHYASRIAVAAEAPAIPTPARSLAGPHAINLYLHDGLLNGLVARLNLEGKETTDRELRAVFDRATKFFGGEPKTDDAPGLPGLNAALETEIEFDAVNPLSLHFREGRMVIEIRAVLRPAGQALLPPLLISTPLQLVNQGSEWQLVRGPIDIVSTNGERLPDVAANLIRQAIEGDFPTVRIPRALDIPNWPADQPKLQLTDLRSADGWLAVSLD